MHTCKNNLRTNEVQRDTKAQCLRGENKSLQGTHSNEELKNFRKTVKRLEVESDALRKFLKMI